MSLPRVFLLADLHADDRNPHVRLETIVDVVHQVTAHARQEDGIVVIAGDIVDKPVAGGKVLDALADMAKGQLWLDGNHHLDKEGWSVISHVGRYGRAKTFHGDMQVWDAGTSGHRTLRIAMVPYGADIAASLLSLKPKDDEVWLAVAHDDVVGANYGSTEATQGLARADLMRILENRITLAMGHIHLPQVLAQVREHDAFYIGAPVMFNWRAVGQRERGYVIFDPDTLTCERHRFTTDSWPTFHNWTYGQEWESPDIAVQETDHAAHVHVIVPARIDPSDAEVEDALKRACPDGAQVAYVKITRERVAHKPILRSAVTMDDSIREMQSKYFVEKFGPVDAIPYIEAMEPILRKLSL